MLVPCPNCDRTVEQHNAPVRGSSGEELWVCIKCPAVVCSHPVFTSPDDSIPCYMKHISEAHPELGGLKSRPTGVGKKNSKHKKR